MLRNLFLSGLALCMLAPPAAAAGEPATPQLSAAQVVEKNITARGGLQEWRDVQTLSFSGRMDAGGKNNAQLPFLMEFKRPHKSRVEIEFANDTAIQVYDGVNGWKVRPFLGREEVEQFTADQLKSASVESELDGFLVDFARKGTTVALAGVDQVEGRDAYKLRLTLKGGDVRHLWIDAKTSLEVKIEGIPRRLDGKMHPVEVYYRDFRSVDGLMVPYVLESAVKDVKQTYKITIEKVVINPKLEDARFTKPSLDATPSPGG